MKLPRLLLLGIVVTLPGCDNVTWGGIDARLQTSGERLAAESGAGTPEPGIVTVTEAPPVVDIGPLFLIGRPKNGQVELTLVGQLREGKLQAAPDDPDARVHLAERLSVGNRFTLFSEGSRVGTFFAESGRVSTDYCGQRPSLRGVAELVPAAAQARQFIAIEGDALPARHSGFQSPRHDYDQRVASLAMIRDAIPKLGATWPPSLLEIRRDIQVFQDSGEDTPTIAATFVYEDGLTTGSAPSQAYSVFLLGEDRGTGYSSSFVTYRRVGDDGKGAPRFFDHLDWDGDGESEVVLEVMGESDTWVSGLDRGQDGWTEVYHDPCGLPSPNAHNTP
jgi:hypothetical protein